jgi:hypothetical protein
MKKLAKKSRLSGWLLREPMSCMMLRLELWVLGHLCASSPAREKRKSGIAEKTK